ncbi:hypothetical protein CEXT_735601 [Caerostris extrusa]|uniref:Uncharacterized protein n=1 Tax=Caerostris extrusa TaxID=172846 RepID=A0AAV4Y9I4_CAEEX|nr:hypothetical protein CEXT_735601 [Caerostris extrusa]
MFELQHPPMGFGWQIPGNGFRREESTAEDGETGFVREKLVLSKREVLLELRCSDLEEGAGNIFELYHHPMGFGWQIPGNGFREKESTADDGERFSVRKTCVIQESGREFIML